MHGAVALQVREEGQWTNVLATIVPLEEPVEGVIGLFSSMIADQQRGAAPCSVQEPLERLVVQMVSNAVENQDVGWLKFLLNGIGIERFDAATREQLRSACGGIDAEISILKRGGEPGEPSRPAADIDHSVGAGVHSIQLPQRPFDRSDAGCPVEGRQDRVQHAGMVRGSRWLKADMPIWLTAREGRFRFRVRRFGRQRRLSVGL